MELSEMVLLVRVSVPLLRTAYMHLPITNWQVY